MGHGKYIDPFGDARSVPGMTQPVIAGLTGNLYQVQAGETLNLQFVVLPGESKDIEVKVDLCGPGAEAHLKGLYL